MQRQVMEIKAELRGAARRLVAHAIKCASYTSEN